MNGTEIFVPLGFFGMVIAIIYLFVRQKERMALINRGLDGNYFRTGCESLQQLKWGLISIGVALGILLGDIFTSLNLLEDWVAYFSMTFIFGGIALILSYFVSKRIPPRNPMP
jgi:hypothetical protein